MLNLKAEVVELELVAVSVEFLVEVVGELDDLVVALVE